jgi:excisionase family DNA binding protein
VTISSPADRLAQPVGDDLAALLDVRAVAALLGCSTRHVYRLADARRMPPPVRLGALVRWPRQVVEAWISAGCKSCRSDG